jgi:hypothetical protein
MVFYFAFNQTPLHSPSMRTTQYHDLIQSIEQTRQTCGKQSLKTMILIKLDMKSADIKWLALDSLISMSPTHLPSKSSSIC